jgi:CBS domain-containing protein
MIIPLLIATAVAELVAEVFLTDRLMTEKLAHRGFRVDFRTETSPLRMRLAHHVMRAPVSVSADTSVAATRQLFEDEGLTMIAVVDSADRYLGLVTAGALAGDLVPDSPIGPVADASIAPIGELEYLGAALNQLTANNLQALPVIRDGVLVGQLDRADVAAERYRHNTALETRQPGWVRARRSAVPAPAPAPALRVAQPWSNSTSAPTSYQVGASAQTSRRLQSASDGEHALGRGSTASTTTRRNPRPAEPDRPRAPKPDDDAPHPPA